MMEGVSNEACSLAGHWGLGKMIMLYDDNKISIDGHTEVRASRWVPGMCTPHECGGAEAVRAAVQVWAAVQESP